MDSTEQKLQEQKALEVNPGVLRTLLWSDVEEVNLRLAVIVLDRVVLTCGSTITVNVVVDVDAPESKGSTTKDVSPANPIGRLRVVSVIGILMVVYASVPTRID